MEHYKWHTMSMTCRQVIYYLLKIVSYYWQWYKKVHKYINITIYSEFFHMFCVLLELLFQLNYSYATLFTLIILWKERKFSMFMFSVCEFLYNFPVLLELSLNKLGEGPGIPGITTQEAQSCIWSCCKSKSFSRRDCLARPDRVASTLGKQ